MAQKLQAGERILELEAQYISLLQSKVAYLESELNARKADSSQYYEGNVQEKDRAWVLEKIMARRGLYGGDIGSIASEVRIESKQLQKLVGKITKKWGWAEEVTQCRSPYTALIYSWDEAMKESEAAEGDKSAEKARADLKELLSAISSSSGQLDRYFKDRDTLVSGKSITHEALWTIFPPGTLILAWPFRDEPQVFIVQSCDEFVSDGNAFHLICYCFDWNGSEFNRVPFKIGIEPWGKDRKSILELPFYPLSYYEESGKTREDSVKDMKGKLIKRGGEYKRLCTTERGRQMFSYEGAAYLQRGGITMSGEPGSQQNDGSSVQSSSSGVGTGEKQIKGAIVVDFASYIEYQSPQTPLLGSMQRYELGLEAFSPERRAKKVFRDMYRFHWDKHGSDMPINDEQYLLCPPRVLGYVLEQKKWAQLLVKNFTPTERQSLGTLGQQLQLEEDKKMLILNSITGHGIRKEAQGQLGGPEGYPREKGNGLVIMLYGNPGLGKTMTAEFVAQEAGKPLLSISVSDIGIDGDKVETNLQRVFDLAEVWGAVLLFENADYFLAARGEGEDGLKRSAIVSVLPRILENYKGILILTTNWMGSFDAVMRSHIREFTPFPPAPGDVRAKAILYRNAKHHAPDLAIQFEELSDNQKTAIFTHFLTQIKDEVSEWGEVKNWVYKKAEKTGPGGRQLRNIVSAASEIALAKKQKLDSSVLEDVLEQVKGFKEDSYLRRMSRGTKR